MAEIAKVHQRSNYRPNYRKKNTSPFFSLKTLIMLRISAIHLSSHPELFVKMVLLEFRKVLIKTSIAESVLCKVAADREPKTSGKKLTPKWMFSQRFLNFGTTIP